MRPALSLALPVGWAAALLGYWLPWLLPRPAALQLNGFELAEWITRLPGVRDGSLAVGRLHLLGTLGGLVLLGGLLAAREPGLPKGLRWSIGVISALNALFLFPGYPFILYVFEDPEARAQAASGSGVAVLLGLTLFLAPRLSRRIRSALAAALALSTGSLSLWSFSALRPELARLLPGLAAPGVGFYLLIVGCLAAGLAGLAGVRRLPGGH